MSEKSLTGKICLVTGATRGNGRGIAVQLGAAGATVYITGRTAKRSDGPLKGSLEETAEEIESRGGRCIPVYCDHSVDAEVNALFAQISREQDGRLDLLVNNVYAAVVRNSQTCGQPFWEYEDDMWDHVNGVGLRNHYRCTTLAAQLMVPRRQGLIVNISSFGGLRYILNVPYGVGKAAVDRMAADCAVDLRPYDVTMVCLWPGPVRTEAFQEYFNIPEDGITLKGVAKKDGSAEKDGDELAEKPFGSKHEEWKRLFSKTESTELPGKCIVKLASDPKVHKKTGKVLLTHDLANKYNIRDINGKKPPNRRSARLQLQVRGHKRAASFVPGCLQISHRGLWNLANKF